MAQDKEAFLSRWSRLKRRADKEAQQATPKAEPPEKALPGARQDAAKADERKAPPAEPPPLDKLGPGSDFRAFMSPEVGDKLRRAALKKLFADPRFNVMDGLDVYIDDYSKSDPIPEEMLKTLAHARRTLFGGDEEKAAEAKDAAQGQAPEPAPPQVAGAQSEARLDAKSERAEDEPAKKA